ncbi:MAG: hypothetical protein PIR53_16365 [Nocardioides alkalitolerans]
MAVLGDYVDLIRGKTYKGALVGQPGPALLGLGSIVPGGGFRNDFKTYGGECPPDLMLAPGDLFVSLKGATKDGEMIGSIARLPESVPAGRLTQDTVRLVFRERDLPFERYIYWLLRTPAYRAYCAGRATGSAVVALSRADFLSYPVPTLTPERNMIVNVLEAINDKIDSNRRATSLLEALGATILESALVMDATGTPEYVLNRRMGDVAAVLETGSRPKGGVAASDTGVISLGAESIQSAGVIATTAFKRVSEEFVETMRRGRLQDGDVLVYKDGGRPGNFIPHVSAFGQGFPAAIATINEHVYRVRAAEGISQGLLYWVLRSPWMDLEMRKRGTGVAIPGLNSTNFRDLPWPALDGDSARHLNATLEPMLVCMLQIGGESMRLSGLRDALLPELLSGRIREPETAAVVQDGTE